MSNKSTNNRISYGQYKAADIFMFLLIMGLCETVNVLAVKQWFSSPMFSISVMLLISLVVILRWGLIGVVMPMVDGALYCALLGAEAGTYAIYIIGNAFIVLVWVLFKIIPKEKIVSSWLLTLLYAVIGYLFLALGRSLVALCFGESFIYTFTETISGELLNFVFAVIGLLVLRRTGSMLEDQKKYLFKVAEERDNIKPADADYHWDGYTELNTEDLDRLKAMDEYDRQISFNRSSLKKLKEDSGEYPEPDSSDEDDLSRLDG